MFLKIVISYFCVTNKRLKRRIVFLLQLALGVARVLHHLAHSSLGSLAMREVTSQQFVLADGELKLSDADDLEMLEPPCSQHTDCNPPRDPYNITGFVIYFS